MPIMCTRLPRVESSYVCPALLALVVLLGSSFAAGASSAATVGAQIGVNQCGLYGDNPANSSYVTRTGVVAGALGQFDIAHGISLGLEPAYVRKANGWKTAEDAAGDQEQFDLTLDYITLPVVVKFFSAGGHAYCSSGLMFDFLSKATLSDRNGDTDVKSALKSTDVGLLLGVGGVFPIGRPSLTTELRFVHGLVNPVKDNATSALNNLPVRVYSYGFELIAGIQFPLGNR